MDRATLLHNMKDNIISLFEGYKYAKENDGSIGGEVWPKI
jgi:hypothetical protein